MNYYTHEDQLVIISMWEDEPKEAQKAFDSFFESYKKYVWNVAFILAKTLPNSKTAANDIFTDTFLAVKDNADKFDSNKCKSIENGVKNWLSGIAKNQFLRYLDAAKRSNGNVHYLETCPDVAIYDEVKNTSLDNEEPPPRFKVLNTALETVLNDKEREILLISLNFESNGGIPPEIKQSLCKAYGLLPDSLRQIKKRAIEKLEKFGKKHGYSSAKKSKSNVR